MKHGMIFTLATMLVIVALLACQQKPTEPEENNPPVDIGTIQVVSLPNGAAIWLDEQNTNSTTPTTLDSVPAGYHELTLTKDGYDDWYKLFTLSNNSLFYVYAILEAPISGTLRVYSTPQGAAIWLNGDSTGYTTPKYIFDLPATSYNLKLVKFGYHDWTDSVTVDSGATNYIDAQLQIDSLITGLLNVNSLPSDAEIHIDNLNTGFLTPHLFDNLTLFDHDLKLIKDGYYSWQQNINISANETTYVSVELQLLNSTLILNSQPSGAQIWVNNSSTNMVTPDTLITGGQTDYNVRFMLADYFPFDTTLTIDSGQTVTINKNMVGAPAVKIAYSVGDDIWVIKPDGLNPVLFAENFNSYRIQWSPDGQFLSYYNNNYGITVLNDNGSLVAELPFGSNKRSYDFSWSNNSQFEVNGAYYDGIYSYDTVLDSLTRIYGPSGPRYDHNPVYSPDDSQIAFIHHEYGSRAWIKLMQANGSNAQTLYGYFNTAHDELLDLTWIDANNLILKIGSSGICQFEIPTPPDTSELIQVYSGQVTKLRISSNRQNYALLYGGIKWNIIGNWEPITLSNPSTGGYYNDLSWSPNNDAVVGSHTYGVYWVNLDGTTYKITKNSSPASNNYVSTAPNTP